MRLKFFNDGPPTQFSQFYNTAAGRTIKPQGQFLGGDIEFELEKLLGIHATSIPVLRLGRVFNQLVDFDWIDGGDVRQIRWLIDRVHNGLSVEVPDARARFSDRDYFICLVDLVALPIVNKRDYLSGLHRSWMEHLKNTSYLNWFSRDGDPGRWDFAWQALDSRLGSMFGQEFKKYPGAAGLKCYFDSLHASGYEKKSHIDHIKKLWNQRKYRERQEKNKVRQRNFVLSDTTIKNLDKLAKGLGVSRTEALECLIELAAKHGMPGTPVVSSVTLDLPGDY